MKAKVCQVKNNRRIKGFKFTQLYILWDTLKIINIERQELLTRFAKGIKDEDEVQTAGTGWPLLHSTFYFIFFRIHPLAAGGFRKKMLSSRRNLVWVSIFYSLLEATQSTENRTLPQTPEPIFYKARRKTSAATNIRAKAGKAVEIRTGQMGACTREVHATTEPRRPGFYNESRHYVTKFKLWQSWLAWRT